MWNDKNYDKNTWSLQKVQDVFNSSGSFRLRGAFSEYSNVYNEIISNRYEVNIIPIICKKLPVGLKKKNIRTFEDEIMVKSHSRGHSQHSFLKYWIYFWACDRYGFKPRFEQTIKGYGIADLYIEESQVVIECGDSQARKLIVSLDSLQHQEFIIVPFQRAALENSVFGVINKIEVFCFKLKEI